MSEIDGILNQNEEILWKSSKVKNLVLTWPVFFPLLIGSLAIYLFISIGITEIEVGYIIMGIFDIILGIVMEFTLVFSTIFIFRYYHSKYRRILNATNEELKEYNIVNAVSNQRIIIKDIIRLIKVKKKVEKNSISHIKFDKDFIFLSLENVEAIILQKKFHQVRFLVDKNRITPLIYFNLPYPRNEATRRELIGILKKNFSLEKYFEDEFETKYNFRLK